MVQLKPRKQPKDKIDFSSLAASNGGSYLGHQLKPKRSDSLPTDQSSKHNSEIINPEFMEKVNRTNEPSLLIDNNSSSLCMMSYNKVCLKLKILTLSFNFLTVHHSPDETLQSKSLNLGQRDAAGVDTDSESSEASSKSISDSSELHYKPIIGSKNFTKRRYSMPAVNNFNNSPAGTMEPKLQKLLHKQWEEAEKGIIVESPSRIKSKLIYFF